MRWSPAVLTAIALAGCGGPEGGADQLQVYSVTPKVTVDGKPLGGAQLTMSPSDPAGGLPNSGATLDAEGSGSFSTYGPGDGIPAGEYTAGLMPDALAMKPVPSVEPVKLTIDESMDGGEVKIDFKSTGKETVSILPRQ